MSRLKGLGVAALGESQRALINAITGGKRAKDRDRASFFLADGSLRGPFNAWLHAPSVGQPAQALGEAIRFDSSLSPRLRELAILSVAAFWRADYEWWAHRPIAVAAGLPEPVVAGIMAGELPRTADAELRAVYEFSMELMTGHRISDTVYEDVADRLGERGTVELVAVIGYYTLVAMTLNAFQVGMPEGAKPPFANVDRPSKE
ncbi:MAG: carboxymuconolactone decarboxylase family protein [Gammaproteobacteria bacterium]|nr:carboxymuconolactone decarboxylase family protein [Gammaproteobacteria bacterium]